MPVEMGMWRIDGSEPRRLNKSTLPSEATLEDYLEQDPSLLGTRLLVIGRQVRTPYGKFIDLLAIDAEGNLQVLELKRDKTPRDVVAQVLDYGVWVTTLTRSSVTDIANDHLDQPFEVAFEEVFGETPPDELNTQIQMTIIATDLDDSSERIVTYLRDFGVPVNAVFFSYLEDDERRYLARSWLAAPQDVPSGPLSSGKRGKRAEWNGRDWYISFGDGQSRSWEDGRKYGFVSGGGGTWYSRTLVNLPVGARVNVYIPQHGYVAVGQTLAEAKRFDQADVRIDGSWVSLKDQKLESSYRHGDATVTDDNAEYVIPVLWLESRPKEEAYREKGMFAKQLTACKLRDQFTLDLIAEHFGLNEDGVTHSGGSG